MGRLSRYFGPPAFFLFLLIFNTLNSHSAATNAATEAATDVAANVEVHTQQTAAPRALPAPSLGYYPTNHTPVPVPIPSAAYIPAVGMGPAVPYQPSPNVQIYHMSGPQQQQEQKKALRSIRGLKRLIISCILMALVFYLLKPSIQFYNYTHSLPQDHDHVQAIAGLFGIFIVAAIIAVQGFFLFILTALGRLFRI